MCKRCACARVLRIGCCLSTEQERRAPATTTAGREDLKEDLLHCDRKLAHSATLRSASCNSDHSWRTGYFRPPYGAITKTPTISPVTSVLPARSADVDLRFRAPRHHSAQSRTHLFDWMLFGVQEQLRVTRTGRFHF